MCVPRVRGRDACLQTCVSAREALLSVHVRWISYGPKQRATVTTTHGHSRRRRRAKSNNTHTHTQKRRASKRASHQETKHRQIRTVLACSPPSVVLTCIFYKQYIQMGRLHLVRVDLCTPLAHCAFADWWYVHIW